MVSKEEREAARASVSALEHEARKSSERICNAADQILEVSSRLHLTWDEFERAVALVKRRAHIS